MTEAAFVELRPLVKTKRACQLLGKPRATHYRRLRPGAVRERRPRPTPPNALSPAERQAVLDALHRPEHADLPPAQVWARLIDEGTYLASISTMYRLLGEVGENRDRRRQRTHPARTKPQLLASAPNEVWSWDLTKLPGPARHEFYELYAVIDIFSRYVPGWLVAPAESAELAEAFIAETIARNGAAPRSLHADRGSSMTSKPVAQLLVDLGVARSHSRPHVSNDNPYSEANFKTLKYFPEIPEPSAPFRTLAPSARRSSPTTTTSTATGRWACTRRLRSTSAPPPRSGRHERWCSMPPTPPTPTASPSRRSHRSCPPPPGSTSRRRRRSYRRSDDQLSQRA